MNKVTVKPYLSPTLVFLAMDWKDGFNQEDFLGFAIKRIPGFRKKSGGQYAPSDWLPNRIGFDGPNPNGADLPSDTNPIQHFQWFDARIDTEDRGQKFTYTIYPVVGTKEDHKILEEAASKPIICRIPQVEEQGIGTYFNRAVVSSQAFVREFGTKLAPEKYDQALAWLSNGMHEAVLSFITKADGFNLSGAAYHLTDNKWIIPALAAIKSKTSIVYFYKKPSQTNTKDKGDSANVPTVNTLKINKNIRFYPRTKTSIMHDKFLVRHNDNSAEACLTGTANFTTEGLTEQANMIHTFESPKLAQLYLNRQQKLIIDPSVAATAAGAEWSEKIQVGDATIRVFFPPEPNSARKSIDVVVDAVSNAKSSVIFSLFSATDQPLLDACKSTADNGKLMMGLVNHVTTLPTQASKKTLVENASTYAATWIYEQSKNDHMVVGHDEFSARDTPVGFWPEVVTLKDPSKPLITNTTRGKDKGSSIPPVFIHQKIIVVDGETDSPTIYVGSANMSKNSVSHNDENLLEITNCTRLAKIYLAEFLRLYEHYKSRFAYNQRKKGAHNTFTLAGNSSWAGKDYKPGTVQYQKRTKLT